jgi:peptidyl-prolyl cis-trans isomerase SurA
MTAPFTHSYNRFFRSFAVKTALIGIILSLWISSGQAQDTTNVIDRIVAIVGNQVVLESEIFQNSQAIAMQQGMNPARDPAGFQKLQQDVLNEMVNQKIMLAKAKEDTIRVEPREVDRELENRIQMMIKNVGSEAKVEEAYGMSLNRIRREFRQSVEDGLIVEKVKQSHLRGVSVSRSEVEQYFKDNTDEFPPMKDAVELEHILRQIGSESADARAQARADSIYQAIKTGASFNDLAKKLSDDPTTSDKHGSIGWTEKGDLMGSYEEAAYALKVGELSRPVRTRNGYSIIRLDDRKEDKILTSHILIVSRVQPEDEGPVVDSLQVIREKISNGMPFEEAAKNYSQDLESAGRGGYLGWFAVEEMPEDFKAAVDTLQEGQISEPFKTEYGYHLARLLSRRDAHTLTLDQDWEMISQRVLTAKKEKEYKRWLDDLKSRYYIEIKS